MKLRKFSLALSIMLVIGLLLGACGKDKDDGLEKEKPAGTDTEIGEFSVAMVTAIGRIDDQSFNHSAWKGIQEFAKANNLKKGDGGYDYLQSTDAADYSLNLDDLARRDFNLIFGVGHFIADAVGEIAEQQSNTNFAIIDGVVDRPNVVNILFKDQEAGYLAGVTAALMTESNKVGFIGGMETPVIERFQAGFEAGIDAVNPDVEIDIRYTDSFEKADFGKSTASLMYSSGIDIIFHASGATGNGVFAEAKERKKADPGANIWVIGVDADQYEAGQVGNHNITLTSAMKQIDASVDDLAKLAMNDKFPGGETIVYGVAEGRIVLADSRGAIPEDVLAEIDRYTEKIATGEIEIPEHPKEKELK